MIRRNGTASPLTTSTGQVAYWMSFVDTLPSSEPVEGVEAFTAHHQEPVPFRRAFQDRLTRPPLAPCGPCP